MTPKTNAPKPRKPSKKMVIITAIIASVLLLLANSAFWVNRQIFDADNFSDTVTSSLTSQSSRKAIAQDITNRALADKPVVQSVAGDTITNVIGGVLGSNLVDSAIHTASNGLHLALTTKNKQGPITIDLRGVKDLLAKASSSTIAQNRGVTIDGQNIPSEVVLLENDNIPDFYKYSVVLLWVGPVAFILALGSLMYPYILSSKDKYKTLLATQGTILLISGALALLVGPLFRPPFLANIDNSNTRVVAGNLYDSFVRTFNLQTSVILIAGAGAVVYATVSNPIKNYQITKKKR